MLELFITATVIKQPSGWDIRQYSISCMTTPEWDNNNELSIHSLCTRNSSMVLYLKQKSTEISQRHISVYS